MFRRSPYPQLTAHINEIWSGLLLLTKPYASGSNFNAFLWSVQQIMIPSKTKTKEKYIYIYLRVSIGNTVETFTVCNNYKTGGRKHKCKRSWQKTLTFPLVWIIILDDKQVDNQLHLDLTFIKAFQGFGAFTVSTSILNNLMSREYIK